MDKRRFTLAGWVLAGGASLAGAAACGNGFGGTDCVVTRTCPAEGGDGSASRGGEGGDASIAAAGDSTDGSTSPGSSGAPTAPDGGGAAGAGDVAPANLAPKVISVTPEADAANVALDASIVIQLSEPLDAATVTPESVRLLLGDEAVAGTVTYADSTITFKPRAPLVLLGDYSISISTAIADVEGASMSEAFLSSFVSRDGVWSTIDALKKPVTAMASAVPLSPDGTALMVWSGDGQAGCPITAQPFLLGMPAAKSTFAAGDLKQVCGRLQVAGNASGLDAISWVEPDSDAGSHAQQLRDGLWLPQSATISKAFYQESFGLSVGADDIASFFSWKSGDGSKVWHTDTAGTWQSSPDTLDSLTPTSRATIAFDAKGDGLAIWRAADPDDSFRPFIVAARYSAAKKGWSASTRMPGTETAPGAPALAVDADGNAVAVWVRNKQLMASHFTPADGWEAPVSLSADSIVDELEEAPALVFDGQRFVAAWTAAKAGSRLTYTASYEPSTEWSSSVAQQQVAADGKAVGRMPRLGTDGRGNVILVWAKGTSPKYTLVWQRYTHGKWGAIAAVPGGTVSASHFEEETLLPLSVNASGMAALAWANTNGSGDITGLRLASFF